MKIILIVNVLIFAVSSAYGQFIVSGFVKDKKGDGLPYANIGVKGGKIGTISGLDGKFSISIPENIYLDSDFVVAFEYLPSTKIRSYLVQS